MNAVINCALRAFLAAREDIFGKEASFLRFKSDPNFNCSDGHKSNSTFGRIIYKNANDDTCLSPPLLLKYTSAVYFVSAVANNMEFVNEIIFYTQLLPFFSSLRDIGHMFPQFFSSHLDVNLNAFDGVIIFENLQATGFTTSERKSFLDYDHLALMMKKLGEFHAYSYEAKRTDADSFFALSGTFAEPHLFSHRYYCEVLSVISLRGVEPLRDSPQYSSKVAELEKLMKSTNELIKRVVREGEANPLAVLCHGDYLRNNVLFRYEKGKPVDLKMVDLATCKLTSPVVDLAMVLYINADQEMRKKHWDDLIDAYYTALRDTFPKNKVPSKDSILAEFKGKTLVGYFVASCFLNCLIADDNDMPTFWDLLPEEYKSFPYTDLPPEVCIQTDLIVGGELSTKALSNILKDMIDRGFL